MSGLVRRGSSGVYYVRLVVPMRLRHLVGKRELVMSTRSKELMVAKIVGAELLALWRRRLFNLDRTSQHMDLPRLIAGSPSLTHGGLLTLAQAAAASGLDEDDLLHAASDGRMGLFHLVAGIKGHLVPFDALEPNLDHYNGPGCDYLIPSPDDMPAEAWEMVFTGSLQLDEPTEVAVTLLTGSSVVVALFEDPGSPGHAFVPDEAVRLERASVRVAAEQVEALRVVLRAKLTPEQLAQATNAHGASIASREKAQRSVSAAIDAYMRERAATCKADQARRIRAACELFVELIGDRPVGQVDRELLRRYRDDVLPTVPAAENRVRTKFRTRSVTESIKAVAGTDWKPLSNGERVWRMTALAGLFSWLEQEGWIVDDPAVGLAKPLASKEERKKRDQDARDSFDDDDLRKIFSAAWFKTGRGELTQQGTYREFCPHYYWLPLLGLFTGARINELCQLQLRDIRVSDSGVWFVEVTDDGEGQQIKNRNSRRLVPLHRVVLGAGLRAWIDALRARGHERLFPELSYDPNKGYSKGPVKWFGRFKRSLGWESDGRKTFHSFRHTFASECLNRLGLPPATVAQLTGHARGSSTLVNTYRKDVVPDELVSAVEGLSFQLPELVPFDVEAGLKALDDAMRRKNGGRGGAVERRAPTTA